LVQTAQIGAAVIIQRCASLPAMRCLRWICFGLLLVLAASADTHSTALAAARTLRIATWNMEWLVDGPTAHAARIACRDNRPAPLPCDVVRELARDSADLARLARYAERLDADVIGFQEVQNEAIAQRVFRGYRICMNGGAGVQHVGFALRPGLARDCGKPVAAVSADGAGRAGRELTLTAPGFESIELLVVHLKSGCAREPLHTATEACRLLAIQARELGGWIGMRSARHAPFVVLGDLNRGGPALESDRFWSLLDPPAFLAAASQLPFANCSRGAPYREFIDHILVSRTLVDRLSHQPFDQLRYTPTDAAHYHLSDHCPVSVSLNANSAL
jgi:endonuclease/exonuclease/phosphatase family metal-dependent hydrolase